MSLTSSITPIRLAVIGGGDGPLIGDVHWLAGARPRVADAVSMGRDRRERSRLAGAIHRLRAAAAGSDPAAIAQAPGLQA